MIFNVTARSNLAVIAKEAFSILAARHKKIDAILNLDVGSYDILRIFDDSGQALPDVKGTVDEAKATNLIVYFR